MTDICRHRMSSLIKKLAGQTAVYGLTSLARLVYTLILVPLQSRAMSEPENGTISFYFGLISFANVLLMYGMETAYFRFSTKGHDPDKVFSTALRSVFATTLLFFLPVLLLHEQLAAWFHFPGAGDLVIYLAIILATDAWCALPFARLRQQNKPGRFAAARIANIAVNILINVFYLWYCPHHTDAAWVQQLYTPEHKVLYVFIANVAGSLTSLLMVSGAYRDITRGFDRMIWKQMLRYGFPMLLIGLAGMVNETLDRVMLNYLLPEDQAMFQTGIYGTCYKLAIFMTIFVQAFRFASEPFFFSRSREADAKETYALVMDWFVPACALIFLGMTLGMDIAKHFIDQKFWSGLHVVPVLLLANWCLGIYINISIWYKVTDHTSIGSYISVGGAVITLLGLYIFVPVYGYTAAAWVTLTCYATMMVAGYLLGRKYYPIPYRVWRNLGIMAAAILMYMVWEKSK